jgi:hypothetical protein
MAHRISLLSSATVVSMRTGITLSLTVSEYRMSRMTALKLSAYLQCAAAILQHVHQEVPGSELLAEEEN